MAAAGSAWLDLEIILFWKGLYQIRILQVYMQLPYSDVAFIHVHGNQLMTRNALIMMFTQLSEKGDLLYRGDCKKHT